jgi:hypothetical protein
MTTMTDVGNALMAKPEPVWPTPGIYHNVESNVYHGWLGASVSRLKEFGRSPAHCRAYMDAPSESTTALEIGAAAHYALLQPDHFDALYLAGPCDDKRKKAWLDFVANNPFATILKPAEYDDIMRMCDAIRAHPAARLVLSSITDVEVSMTWKNEARCKARIDAVAPSLTATVELKTARDASVDGFSKAVYDLKYYWQAAHYLDGYNGLTGSALDSHIIIAAEKEAPYAVNVFALRSDAIDAGRLELAPLYQKWADCEASGQWPQESHGYSTKFTDLSLPPWAWRKIDERAAA